MPLFQNVKDILDKRKISVIEFEKNIGLQRGGFYKWKNHDPGISYVKKASDFLNVPIDEIVK